MTDYSAGAELPANGQAPAGEAGLASRLFNRRVGGKLMAAIGFLTSNSLHYALGRSWIFRGTDRAIGSGYLIFLVNAGVGMAITILLFAALLKWTAIHYLVARVIVSVFAGLAMFVLNAVLNFRQV